QHLTYYFPFSRNRSIFIGTAQHDEKYNNKRYVKC
ncbi:unnamed protein product, partial [marine sediment metagenome]